MQISNSEIFKWQFRKIIVLLSVLKLNDAIETSHKSQHLVEFQYCLRQSKQPNLRECFGRSAIIFLQRLDEKDNVTLADDIVATKDDSVAGRSLVNFLDTDPVDIRGILENAGAVIGQRSFEWHMDRLYPGLMLKIGPSADTNSVAEFVLDPTIDERLYNGDDVPTARILTKQYILPFLLGLKFNLVALVPILFAVICLLLKKALFIAKLVIYVSSLLGVGGVAGALGSLGGGLGGLFTGHHQHGHHHHGGHFPGFLGEYPVKKKFYSHYEDIHDAHDDHDDVLQHFKRQDRKVVFEKPRETANNVDNNNNKANTHGTHDATEATAVNNPVEDHFYDFERQVLLPDRSGKLRQGHGKLGPSAYADDFQPEVGVLAASANHRFMTAGSNSGWNLVRVQ